MAKHRNYNRRSRVFWEVYWTENGQPHLVQETSYTEVIKRMGRLVQNPQVRQSGFRQLQR